MRRRIEDARGTIRYVATQLRFTDAQQGAILDHYLGAGRRRNPPSRHQRRPRYGPGGVA
jgi:hypothetical protein